MALSSTKSEWDPYACYRRIAREVFLESVVSKSKSLYRYQSNLSFNANLYR